MSPRESDGDRRAAPMSRRIHHSSDDGLFCWASTLTARGVVLGVGDEGQVQTLRVGRREPRVAVLVPLHRRPDAVAVAQVDVVAHADLVAVVDDRCARQGEQEGVHQLDPATVVAEQRGEAPPDPEVDPCLRVLRVDPIHVVPLLVGHHLERQLVMVAQERRPLSALGDRGRLVQDVDEREAILHPVRHEHPRHQWEVERHVAPVAVPEVGDRVLRPLVGLGQEHAVLELPVDVMAEVGQELERLREVLAVRSLSLEQVGDGVQPQPVDAEAEPEVHDVEHRRSYPRLVEVEVRLMGVEAMPVVLPGDGIPRPVRRLEVAEDDAGVGIAVRRVRPHVEVALPRAGFGGAGALEPRMLLRGVVHDHLGDHAQIPPVCLAQQGPEVSHRPVGRVDRLVRGDVVAVVAERRWVEGEQPDGRCAQVSDVIQPFHETGQVADTVGVAVLVRPHVQLVDHGILVPAGGGRSERRHGQGLRRLDGRRLVAGARTGRHEAGLPASIASTCPG